MKIIKKLFLIFGLVSIVDTTDAMHVNKSNKKVTSKKNTGSKLVCAPKSKKTPAKKPKQDDGKFPVIPEGKKPAQAAPTEEQVKLDKELRELKAKTVKFMELCKSDDEKTVAVARDYFKNLWMWSDQQSIL